MNDFNFIYFKYEKIYLIMENYFNKNINSIKSESMSPKRKRNNSAQIDLNYINKLYDKKNIILQNRLFTLIIKFHSIFKKIITDINSVLITLGNQAICSKSLLLNLNKNNERLSHLNDRLEMINDTKNLLDNNLLIANNNLNMFISEVQKNFKELKILKIEKEKNIRHFYAKKRTKRINKSLNHNSVPKRKNDENYMFLNSNPNVSNKKNKIDNKINFITTNSKKDFPTENYVSTPKESYFNYIKANNIYSNNNRNQNISNEYPQYCQSPDNNYFSNNNMIPKKKYCNKSQEIIEDKLPKRLKQVHRSKSNFSCIMHEKRNNNNNYTKMKCENNVQRRNYGINEKNFNISNANKKMKDNYFTNWSKNFKKINYRDKILYKQNK